MMIMERAGDLQALLDSLRGKRVAVWTCNTCARLCNGMGGDVSANRLADRMRSEGIEVTCVLSTSAACLRAKVKAKECPEIDASDVILALTCDVGAGNACEVFGKTVINPFVTVGTGYIDEDGRPFLRDGTPVSGLSSPFL